jgi:hypothetical protein
MATAAQEAERQVIAAREALGGELDELSAAARSAVDIPAKIRHNPVQTAALAGGAGFLVLGGPKRVLRAVVKRVRPQRADRHRGLLPNEVEKAIKDSAGPRAPEVQAALEQDFADYLKKKAKQEPPPNAAQSLWKTYDALIGPLAAMGAKQLAGRLFAAQKDRPPVSSADAEPSVDAKPRGEAGSEPGKGRRGGGLLSR